jgi:hypothetical protein
VNKRICIALQVGAAIIMAVAVMVLSNDPQTHCGRDAGATVQWLYCDGVR